VAYRWRGNGNEQLFRVANLKPLGDLGKGRSAAKKKVCRKETQLAQQQKPVRMWQVLRASSERGGADAGAGAGVCATAAATGCVLAMLLLGHQ